jgi:2,4-dienoyl-CoA reductase-like NADH-dependent reductase (Old Yellow Enzyme family)/thioredoxin reductase
MQLHHAGRLAAKNYTGCQPVAPSAIPAPGKDTPRELSIAEIKTIVDKFAAGAERAQKAGFDAVEIQACGGYLLIQFLSPDSNKRQDAYGGNLRNRARILLDIVAAIRNKVGTGYPVWVRLVAKQFHTDHGVTVKEARQVAHWLEEAGVVALNVTADYYQSAMRMPWKVEGEKLPRPPMAHPHGFLIPLAAEIKKVVNVPIMAVGWMSPETGEQALREGKIDMVVMGRPLLADPEIPNKIASGRLDDIKPCIGCLMCQVDIDKGVKCAVNASAGREHKYPIVPSKKRKRVVVVGGGPAGLEAARVAALRGHEVILLEKGKRLGGQLLLASLPPHKGILSRLSDYLTAQVERLGVKIELGSEATPEIVLKAKPDAVIVATGVTRSMPKLPGIEKAKVVDATDVLAGRAEVGNTVVVIGGGVVGGETAEFLADKGKKVTIVEMLDDLATGMERWHKQYLLERLKLLGVTIFTKTKAEAVEEKGLVVSTEAGTKQLLPADTIVSATGAAPNQELYRKLSRRVPEIYLVGDCVEPRRILEAIAEGFLASQAI